MQRTGKLNASFWLTYLELIHDEIEGKTESMKKIPEPFSAMNAVTTTEGILKA